jgi:hypothetical protein
MARTRSHARALTVVAAAALALTACGDSAENGIEQLIESQGGGDVDLDLDSDGGISIQTEEGGMTMDEDGNFVITDENGDVVSGNVDVDGDGVTVESEDGSFSSGSGSELPESWPGAVPEPDGLAILSSSTMSDGDTEGYVVIGEVGGDFLDGYVSALEAAGFDMESEFTAESMSERGFTNGTWNVGIAVFENGDDVQATITVFTNE